MPRLRVVNLQVVTALALIVVGAFFFVDAVEHLSTSLGVDPLILALVIAPIATELPEKFNSVIWVRQGKDTLAMGNITGAMVFQSTIPTIVALLFAADAWHISDDSRLAFLSAGIAFVSSAAIFIPMARSGRLLGRRLLLGGGFYVLYLGDRRPVAPGRLLGSARPDAVIRGRRGPVLSSADRPITERRAAAIPRPRAADPRRSVRMLTQKSSPAGGAAPTASSPRPSRTPTPPRPARATSAASSPTSRAASSRCATRRSAS